MKIETILLVINQFILFGFLICIIILFNKEKFNNSEKLNNTENFGDAPASPYPKGTGPHILLTDDNGNMTKDQNSATLTSWVNGQITSAIKNLQDQIYGKAVQTTTIQNLIDSIHQIQSDTTYMKYGDNFTLNLPDQGVQVAVSGKGEGQLLEYNSKLAHSLDMKIPKFNAKNNNFFFNFYYIIIY